MHGAKNIHPHSNLFDPMHKLPKQGYMLIDCLSACFGFGVGWREGDRQAAEMHH